MVAVNALLTNYDLTQQHNSHRFSIDLYHELAKAQQGNIFFSGFSISTAMAMTLAGAGGATRRQLAEVLQLDENTEDTNTAFRALLDLLAENPGTFELLTGNALWGQTGYNFNDEFVRTCQVCFGAEVHEVDYRNAHEAARQRINGRISELTKGRISELLNEGTIGPLTTLILTNAIYFKSDWHNQFDVANTCEKDFFYLPAGDSVTHPLMNQTDTFNYADRGVYTVLEMPYKDQHCSMLVFLPKVRGGLAAMEAHLTAQEVDAALASLRPERVAVTFPRFKQSSEFALKSILDEMVLAKFGAAARAFQDTADFGNMSGENGQPLKIDEIIHKAGTEVDEKGTTAWAATAVTMVMATNFCPRPMAKIFRADHPFVYAIRHNKSNEMLFLGRLIRPA